MKLVYIFLLAYVALFFVGLFGYKTLNMGWTDSLLNTTTSMVGGNPYYVQHNSTASKIFTCIFVILSHIAFLVLFALIVAYVTTIEFEEKDTQPKTEVISLG